MTEADVLFLSIGEGAIVTDADARVSRVNQAALKILGYKEKELLGKWFPGVVKALDEQGRPYSNIDRPMAEVFITGQVVSRRANYVRKNGTVVPVFLTVSPMLIGSKPVGAIEVFRDITDELALEKAKDEFVAIASHQLRTPATAVKQYVGLLLEGYSDELSDNQRMFLERAYESNERQLHIVQEILKITQLDLDKVILKLSDNDLRDIAKQAIDTVKSNFDRKHQNIVLKVPKEPIIAKVDPDQLRVAIENLLENASNYTWENKTVTVTVAKVKNGAAITIKDEGVGIAPADMPRLFQKFSRIPNPLSLEINGTGLGLYWAARIVQLHGGTIKVKSAVDAGSAFKISLADGL